MLSNILWVIGWLISLFILYIAFKVFLVVMGIKKVLDVAKGEMENLPRDYQSVRKEVVNENSSMTKKAKITAKVAIRTSWRWFKNL